MPNTEDRVMKALEKAVDTAIEFCKQQIAFATALIALSVTFNKELIPKADIQSRVLLAISWLALFGSTLFGLLTIGRISAKLSKTNQVIDTETLWDARQFSVVQLVLLFLGLILLGLAVIPHIGKP